MIRIGRSSGGGTGPPPPTAAAAAPPPSAATSCRRPASTDAPYPRAGTSGRRRRGRRSAKEVRKEMHSVLLALITTMVTMVVPMVVPMVAVALMAHSPVLVSAAEASAAPSAAATGVHAYALCSNAYPYRRRDGPLHPAAATAFSALTRPCFARTRSPKISKSEQFGLMMTMVAASSSSSSASVGSSRAHTAAYVHGPNIHHHHHTTGILAGIRPPCISGRGAAAPAAATFRIGTSGWFKSASASSSSSSALAMAGRLAGRSELAAAGGAGGAGGGARASGATDDLQTSSSSFAEEEAPSSAETSAASAASAETSSGGLGGVSLPSNERNWHVCPRETLVADRKSAAAAVSPFVAPAVPVSNPQGGVDGDDEGVTPGPICWSNDGYKSALGLYTALVDYCASAETDTTNNGNTNTKETDSKGGADTGDKDEDVRLAKLISSALDTLHQAYRLYGPESVVGSYNGGKDAVVILHLMRAAYANYLHEEEDRDADSGEPSEKAIQAIQPRVIYFEHKDEFPQVLELLHDTVQKFDLNMVAFEEGIKFSDGLRLLVETNYVGDGGSGDGNKSARPYPMGFVLGTRSSDPNAGTQGSFAPSSSFMPPFMRVNPILCWDYGDVWTFLRKFDLPYCTLYDEGYTSLGNVKDTLPCPALAKDMLDLSWEEDTGNVMVCEGEFYPAYMLEDYEQERAGRIKKEKKK